MSSTVRLQGEGGAIWAFDLPLTKEMAKQVEKGQLKPADDDARQLLAPTKDSEPLRVSDDATGNGSATGISDEGPRRPADTASKADWVAHARAHGIETDGLTKAKLIEAVDQLNS